MTGCADGVLRVLRFDPNRVLGVIGRHRDSDTIERLSISGDDTLLASIGLENCVRLWDIQNLKILTGEKVEEHEEAHEEEAEHKPSKREKPQLSKRSRKKMKKKQSIPNFFSDLNQT